MTGTSHSGELHELSGTEVLDRFAARSLSPSEYLEAMIARVERLEPELNAVCDRRYDEARAEAQASTARYAAGGGGPRGALDGLVVAIKEEQPMAGRSATSGSLVHRDEIADVTHPIVERIQAAGGIAHVRTTTPEYCCAGFTHSTLWGITRNPWNPEFTPGGSSGGSGAALAAGYATMATGSDIGGSIRIPASFSGVVGFKPPFGRVPTMPPFNLDQFCHDGPMARSVGDCALLENVIAGRHKHDVVSLPDPPRLALRGSGVVGRRIALCINLGDFPVDPDVEANTRSVAALLADAGAIVTEVTLPWKRINVYRAMQAHFGAIFGASIGADLRHHADLLTPYARRFADEMMHSELSYFEGMALEGEMYTALGDVLDDHDALLCPTMATRGYLAGNDYTTTPHTVNGVEVEHYLLGALTVPFNMFSRCPVLSVPSGLADNGVPTGAQIVGRTYDDATVFEIGYAIETAVGGFPLAPDRI
jgi:aspartyl-tRNA(Asn)/glutamyl-tRNA(Gln) amidotransferase subunit A